MKALLVLIVCAAALGLLYGCGEDDCNPSGVCLVSEQPLAEFTHGVDASTESGYDSVRIVIICYSAYPDTLVDMYIDESDEGSTVTIDAGSNPDFNNAAATLTNGINDLIYVLAIYKPSGTFTGISESDLLKGGLTGEYLPDLAGTELTKVLVHLDNIYIYDGGTTWYYDIDFRVVIFGRPSAVIPVCS